MTENGDRRGSEKGNVAKELKEIYWMRECVREKVCGTGFSLRMRNYSSTSNIGIVCPHWRHMATLF